LTSSVNQETLFESFELITTLHAHSHASEGKQILTADRCIIWLRSLQLSFLILTSLQKNGDTFMHGTRSNLHILC